MNQDKLTKPLLSYTWECHGNSYTLVRRTSTSDQERNCGYLNTDATGSTARLAYLYNAAEDLLKAVQELMPKLEECTDFSGAPEMQPCISDDDLDDLRNAILKAKCPF